MADDRYGKFVVVWTEDGRPLDRWERTADECRAHVELVSGLVAELRDLAGRCDDVLLGRETGRRFWSRFDANIASLERVAERDNIYARTLDEAAAREKELTIVSASMVVQTRNVYAANRAADAARP